MTVTVTRLCVVPVGHDWIGRLRRTVSSRISPPEAASERLQQKGQPRIRAATEGSRRRRFFEETEAGDPVLFYHDGERFAVGRAGQSFDDPGAGAESGVTPRVAFGSP